MYHLSLTQFGSPYFALFAIFYPIEKNLILCLEKYFSSVIFDNFMTIIIKIKLFKICDMTHIVRIFFFLKNQLIEKEKTFQLFRS